jgi:hypothetical protein
MTLHGRDVVRKLARRIAKDPTSATTSDAAKLARAVLLLVDGRIEP